MIFYATSKDMSLKFDNQKAWLEYLLSVDGKKLIVDIDRETGVRTPTQNSALHLYFEHFAKALNEAGLDMKKVLKPHVEISWNKNTVKEYLWKPIQESLTGKKSTTELDKTTEITEIYEHLNRHFGEKFGIHVPFPKDEKKNEPAKIDYPVSNESNSPTF